MNKITDMLNQQPNPLACTERSQIVIVFTSPQGPNILRYASVKKGAKEFEALKSAWQKWRKWYLAGDGKPVPQFYDADADFFVSCIDLNSIMCLSFVETEKRNKFVPYQG